MPPASHDDVLRFAQDDRFAPKILKGEIRGRVVIDVNK
jgi:hypothetical protein